ncbi:hypothetical protein O6H91_19G015000 [Diphasiastrum complanatum]|nr:hypothetical protein O6H91_19G014600 [Diphasiastrum complanatum]KAJ7520637.1 hypothetical protein O6H91_19G015000 [Diphasiastrum complanatum]KAJ7520639.1 hypothetical protein O6H91_19G015000 [Diphasiastrum complanatum]
MFLGKMRKFGLGNPTSGVSFLSSFQGTSLGNVCHRHRKHQRKSKVLRAKSSQKTSLKDDKNQPEFEQQRTESGRDIHSSIDRRQLLISSFTAAGLPLISNQSLAAPIQPPDLTQCQKAALPPGAKSVNCCLPEPTKVIDFQFDSSLPMRVRKAAHLVDAAYIKKYNQAYELLRNLPDNDPRKFSQQASVHCAFCDSAFLQPNTNDFLEIHNSWLFFPWHRWYLYFHERILAKMLNDDTFALPFWNWDNQSVASPLPNVLPAVFIENPSLLDKLRDPLHQPPTLVDLSYSGQDEGLDPTSQRAANNNLMYQQVVSGAKTPSLFFGQAYRAGDANAPGPGTVENAPHGTVHVWTGDSSQPNYEDMGALYSAASDPIFFAHHANVDRLWTVWKSLGGRRKDITDPDWLNAEFVFYDENASLVKVKVGDALSIDKLSYTYQNVGNPWIAVNSSPLSKSSSVAGTKPVSSNGVASPATAEATLLEEIEEFGEEVEGKFKKLEGSFRSKVKRPVKDLFRKLKSQITDEELEEVLVIQGVEVPSDKISKFDVFINLPDADDKTPLNIPEFAGSFVNVPHLGMGPGMNRKATLRIGIGDKLEQLGIKDLSDVIVTLVPKGKGKDVPIVIKGIKIEYD